MPYIKEIYETGAVIEVTKKHTSAHKGKKTKRSPKMETTPEAQKRVNEGIAIKKLRRIINANFGFRDYHIVLSYEKDNRPQSPHQAKKDLAEFQRAMRTAYKKMGKIFKYVATTEYGKNAMHHHMVISGIDAEVISQCWKLGRVGLFPLDRSGQYAQLASYLIKQTRKTFNDPARQVHKKRWCPSTNLIRPLPKIEIVKADSWREEPKAPKGYIIENCYAGINDVTGYPYQFYSMVKIQDYQVHRRADE